ncbi:MAG: LysR family transcriptional regulator [Planctomycetota bacterium]
MEFDQLKNFIKVAQLGNFTRAAEELGLSQPAISRSIARLEDEIGQPLFERQTRKVALTDAGELLQARAQQILSIIDDTKNEICDDGQSGRIRVAAIPTIAPFFLPELLGQFARKYPKAQVTVQEDTTDNLLKRLTQGEIDLVVIALPVPAKYVEIETLFEEELLLVLPSDHPLNEQRKISVGDLENLPFVLLDEAHCLSDSIVSFCRQRSFHPVSMERTSQLATVQELVALNHGVSMIPRMARVLDESRRRTYRHLSGHRPSRTVVSVWNPYRFQSKLLKAFQSELRQYAQQYAC